MKSFEVTDIQAKLLIEAVDMLLNNVPKIKDSRERRLKHLRLCKLKNKLSEGSKND